MIFKYLLTVNSETCKSRSDDNHLINSIKSVLLRFKSDFISMNLEPVDMTEIKRNKRVVEHLLKSDDINDYYYIKKIAKGDFDNE